MINTSDIISLNIENQWIRDGLNYALMSWTSTFNRMGKPNPYSRLEKIFLGIIAEYAVEKYLKDINKMYETYGRTKWYEEDRYDIGINGYAVDVKSSFLDITSKYIVDKYSEVSNDKLSWFLNCHALVPIDQFNPGVNKRRVHKRNKIYVFPFIDGYFCNNSIKLPLVHTFWDYRWLKKAEYNNLPNLGPLYIGYDGNTDDAIIAIYGTTRSKEACNEKVKLKPHQVVTKNDYFQVFSIEWIGDFPPDGTLTISSKFLDLEETINPECSFSLIKSDNGYLPFENNWQSMGLCNSKIYLLGWINEENFRVKGKEFRRFTKTIEQYSETKVDNWGCIIKELEPMHNIINI